MKTKEHKRREAYERLVKTAQMHYRALLRQEVSFHVGAATRNIQLTLAKDSSAQVWEWHRKYGYPLPDTATFHNR